MSTFSVCFLLFLFWVLDWLDILSMSDKDWAALAIFIALLCLAGIYDSLREIIKKGDFYR